MSAPARVLAALCQAGATRRWGPSTVPLLKSWPAPLPHGGRPYSDGALDAIMDDARVDRKYVDHVKIRAHAGDGGSGSGAISRMKGEVAPA